MNGLLKVLVTLGIIFYQKCDTLEETNGGIFTGCGGLYTEPKGLLHTPNFPEPYPTPIYCEWLIHAPPGKKIFLYFTQNYMKDSIYISSYDFYKDINTYVGREELGQVFWEHDLTFLVGYKPYVLIQFSVEFIGNRNLRVIDHLLDVYGFNITYEFVDTRINLSKQTCSVKTCSYLGNCLVSADFTDYSCHCFGKFFGNNCQYGPYCDPENGVNLCSNGGRCKYFFGSLINQCECPEGYEGAYCELAVSEAISPTVASEECVILKCSHQCEKDVTGQTRCFCSENYRMADDNITCIPIDRYRIDVSLQLERVFNVLNVRDIDTMKEKVYDTLKGNGIKTASDLEIHGIRNMSTSADLEFHFYCFDLEVNAVQGALRAVVDLGDLAGVQLKEAMPTFDKNPELMLSEVMNYDPHPTLRGKMLTLVCAAKGSSRMQFRWFKDTMRVDTSLTQRNAWETIVPHTVHGMFLSVLNIDSVMPIDQGIFTCQVEDFGKTVTGDVAVTVNNFPRVQLDPMSRSVHKGKKITLKCLSPDDSWQQFTYEWYKNGIKISADSGEEYAEDMYPTGVLLVVTEVEEDAEYTCKVTNEAGPANVSAYVFVITDNTTVQLCPKSYVGEVMWSNTSGGHFDVKRCPTEQGGYARRHCECDSASRNCKWGEPNFSKCQSLQLIHIYDELELLRNGYQQTNLSTIFDDLYTFILLKNENAILFSGDMDMVAGILRKLIEHMKTFPKLVERDKKQIEAKRLVDLIGAILVRSSLATEDEKSDIMVGPSLVQTVHNLITGAIDELYFNPPLRITSEEFDISEDYMTEVPCLTCDTDDTMQKQSDEIAPAYYLSVRAYIIHSQHLADLLSYRDAVNNKDKKYEFVPVSAVYSVAHINDDITSFRNPIARIIIDHNTNTRVAKSNTTICLKWNFDTRNIYSGMWTRDGCITTESDKDKTVCDCRLPGHFISGMIPSNVSTASQIQPVKHINIPLLISYCVSLIIVLIALFIYLKVYSHLKIAIHTVHLSFVISIVCSTLARLACLTFASADKPVSEFLGGILTFSFYIALTALTLEMFHIFVITYNIKLILMTGFKFAAICWGLPAVLMIPTIIVSQLLDLDQPPSGHAFCWMYRDTSQFLLFVLVLGLNLSVYVLLLILCVSSLRKWTEEWRYAEKRTYVKSIVKNSVLLLLLLLTICSGIDLEPWSKSYHVACNITFQLSLCVLVLITRCILNKHIRYLCVLVCCGQPRRESRDTNQIESKSFRAFMDPKNVGNVVISQEEDNVSKYYDEVNRTKYTKERKQMLSTLLGSASGNTAGSGGSTRETSVNYNSSNEGSKESTAPSTLTELFSQSGTDCGILISEHSKSTSSVGASGSVKDDVQSCLEIDDSDIGLEKQEIDEKKQTEYKRSAVSLTKNENLNHKLGVHSVALINMPVTVIDHNPVDTYSSRPNNSKERTTKDKKVDMSHSSNCKRKKNITVDNHIRAEHHINAEHQINDGIDSKTRKNSSFKSHSQNELVSEQKDIENNYDDIPSERSELLDQNVDGKFEGRKLPSDLRLLSSEEI